MTTPLGERLSAVLALDPTAGAVEFDGEWHTWGDLAAVAADVGRLIDAAGAPPGAAVGIILRNHPAVVGAIVGVLLGERCIVTVNPTQGDDALGRDLRDLRPGVVIAGAQDWSRPAVAQAVAAVGSVGIEVASAPAAGARHVTDTAAEVDVDGEARPPRPGTAVEMLTSGTTGPPKRVPLSYADFARTIGAAQAHYGAEGDGLRLRTGVAIVNAPLVHMSGMFRTLLNLCDGRRVVLLERFHLPTWLDAVRRHRPKAVSLVPAALGMVLAADVDPADLSSVAVVTSGTSPLSVEVQQAFEERFDVAVLPSYGATEFAGGVAGWTLALHRDWADTKRGSVGRPQPGREVRVVDGDGAEVAPGAPGTIEVRSRGADWVRTTDLGRVDADGFVWIDGRADDAILRGGFKVFPADIVAALRTHPAVADAGATGMPDARVGAVPVAAVELVSGAHVEPDELMAHCASMLTGYKVPARLLVVDSLPRTPSLKVSQPGLAALFEEEVT